MMYEAMNIRLPFLRSGLLLKLVALVGAACIAAWFTLGSAEAGKTMDRYERVSAMLVGRGATLLQQNKPDEARKLFEQAAVANPRSALAYSYLGLAAQTAGNKPLAKRYFSTALEIDPNELHALSWGGQSDLAAADLDGAKAKLMRISRLCGTSCSEYKLLSEAVSSYKSKPN
jgi:tetratricopeptide (TPR) repeat protein